MFSNEVMLLEKENEKQFSSLLEEDQIIIKKIMKRINIYRVNSYDSQVIKRDLIGMSQELNLRKSSLKNMLGDDIKYFAEEIINSSSGISKPELVIKFFSKLSGYFFLWYLFAAYGQYGSLKWQANPIIHLFYFGVVLIIFLMEGFINPLFDMEKGFMKFLPSLISTIIFLIWILVVFKLNDKGNMQLINGGYIIIVSGISYLILKYLNLKNIHKLAEGKKNYIKDIIN